MSIHSHAGPTESPTFFTCVTSDALYSKNIPLLKKKKNRIMLRFISFHSRQEMMIKTEPFVS